MNYINIIVHLNLISGIGPASIINIVDAVGLENLEKIYQFSILDFINLGIPQQKAQALVVGLADIKLLQDELDLIERHNVFIITRWCFWYSKLLAEIHTPPVVLYCQGKIDLLHRQKVIGCVGARKAHSYARDVIVHILTPMLLDDWVIVSGGAQGADSYAHQVALDNHAATIIVVGSGLCHQYPPSNKLLFEQVLEKQGLIISIFPMNLRPDLKTFPARNRIISGLSLGTLVVQAAAKSGALITAQQALDQGREVFVVPGSIFDPLSVGCHDLIQDGAKLVTNAQDILVEFGQFELQQNVLAIDSDRSLKEYPKNQVDSSVQNGQKNIKIVAPVLKFQRHNPLEQAIVGMLVTPMSADQLIRKTEVTLPELQTALFALSLEGIVFQDSMGFWLLR